MDESVRTVFRRRARLSSRDSMLQCNENIIRLYKTFLTPVDSHFCSCAVILFKTQSSFYQITVWLCSKINATMEAINANYQGPVVQSVVSLMSSLVVKILTALVSTISNSQVFLLKNVSSFCKASHIFSAKIIAYMPYLMIIFNDTLTNDIVSFEQLSPVLLHLLFIWVLHYGFMAS